MIRNRSVRKFVHGMRQRIRRAEEKGMHFLEETVIERPRKDPRTSAIELQKLKTFVKDAERAEARNDLEEAERLYIQALTLNPSAYEVQAQLAKLYLTTDRVAKSEAMYREILLEYDDPSCFSNLGLAYFKQEKFEEAYIAYREAYKRDPSSLQRIAALGKACVAAKRYDEACEHLEKAIELAPRDAELMKYLADCYLKINHHSKARDTFVKINKLEPYNEEVKGKLEELAVG